MKIRTGFVSNSSSSSFVVGMKDFKWDKDHMKKLQNAIDKHIGDRFKHPEDVSDFYNTVGEAICGQIDTCYRSKEGLLDSLGYESIDDSNEYERPALERALALFDKGFRVSIVDIDRDGNGGGYVQNWICHNRDIVEVHNDEIDIKLEDELS